jgi:four helix bundle protein
MKKFRTLDLSIEFYQLTQKIKVPSHLRDQLDRAASSITLNLAEGNAKFSYKDKSRIYQIAYGSLRECQAVFLLTNTTDEKLQAVSKHLGSSLYRLIESTMEKSKDIKNS